MSSYSQPLNTNSYSQNSIIPNEKYKPKYLNDSDDDKLNSTIDYQSNKLPLNLFHSAAQYNKMLITYGKNRKKQVSRITDGIITSLEYVNDHIFQKQMQQRAKVKQSIYQSAKPPKKSIQNCSCCCCHQFCTSCANTGHHCSKLSNVDVNKAKQTIDNEIWQVRKGKKSSLNQSVKNIKHILNKHKDKNNNQSRRAKSSIDVSKRNKFSINDQTYLDHSQKPRGKDISHLLIKSLIQFTEKKKNQEMFKLSKLNSIQAKQQYLNSLNERIRVHNLQNSRHSKSKQKSKDYTKHQLALQYWKQIRNQVLASLQNDNYSRPLKKQLTNYQFCVYDHKELPSRKVKMSKQQIQTLRKKNGQKALNVINQQIQQKQQQKARIKQNLNSLQKQRRVQISSCQKRHFNPTADMIQTAFKNIIQPKIQQLMVSKQANLRSPYKRNQRQRQRGGTKQSNIVANHNKGHNNNNNTKKNNNNDNIFKNERIKKSNREVDVR